MAKAVISFVCQECGYDSPSWLGKCPECGSWNSLREISIPKSSRAAGQISASDLKPKTLSEIKYTEKERLLTGFSEMDTVLGGGIVAGSVILLAGDPGIGKSTLLLQVALNVAKETKGTSPAGPKASVSSGSSVPSGSSVLYISGEESEEQIKLRALRLTKSEGKNLLLLSASNTDAIVSILQDLKPKLVIIDSIQTMESENAGGLSGSVSQIRYAASMFIRFAKTLRIPLIIVGHVTKEGMVAGPMTLSHMVDTLLFLEGEKTIQTRLLRSFKNRFGPIDEIGIFTMLEEGLKEVKNPEYIFLTEGKSNTTGSVRVCTLEGTRAFLVEVQGLTVFSKLPYPRRVVSGIDAKRVELLLAVMQKHCNLHLETMDVFINVAGGIKLSDPAVDLGVCLSLFSSLKNISLGKTVAISEVGLLGELRNVPFLEKRIKEAKKLGFKNIISLQTHKTLLEVILSLDRK